MTPYLSRIRDHLIAAHRLRPSKSEPGCDVWQASRQSDRSGGKRNFSTSASRYILAYYQGDKTYLDFREESVERKYRSGRLVADEVVGIREHIAVNADGSIRRRYFHDGLKVRTVRAISLRNFFNLPDEKMAKLLLHTDDQHAWVHELPFCFHPVSNPQLSVMTSHEAYVAHFLGAGVSIPVRLREYLPLPELYKLIQIIPGNYLGTLAAALKQSPAIRKRPPSVHQILYAHYKATMTDPDRGLSQTVRAYVNCCRGMGIKVNLKIRSMVRLRKDFESFNRRRKLDQLPELNTHVALLLPKTSYGLVRLELIHNKRRLLREAEQMESCVDTYARQVVKGFCALYHVTYRGRSYTLEIRKDFDDRLSLHQLKGVKNRPAPQKLKQLVQDILSGGGQTPRQVRRRG